MADFRPAVDKLLGIEKGYAPRDNRNGAVNFGITEKFLCALAWPDTDPKHLTRDQAVDIYRRFFWEAYRIGDFGSQRLAEAFFISVVNMPPKVAVRALQNAINAAQAGTGRPQISVDGLLGRFSISSMNIAAAGAVLEAFRNNLWGFYLSLAQENPAEYADDLAGWKHRLQAL